jgi:hypothetical protein
MNCRFVNVHRESRGFAKKVDNTVYHSPFYQTCLGQNEDIVHKQEVKDFCQSGILIPVISPSSKLCFSNLLRPSITRMKRRGDNGHPCLTPLPLLKKYVASPLMRTTKEEDVTQDIIHLVMWIPNPILRRINLRNSQSTQS